jgi:iron(III) transport system permease protein
MRRRTAWIIFTVATLLLGTLFLWPLWQVVQGGFRMDGVWTFKYLAGVFKNPVYVEGLWNSARLAAGTTLLATLLALPLAWLSNRFEFPGKSFLTALLLVPMILPPFVGAIGFQQLLGPYGALNAWLGLGPVDWLGKGRYFGVIVLQALSLYPILYLNLSAALANIDPAMEEAAANLGASVFTRFRRVVMPLMMPGFFAGGTIIFIWSFTELGTPLMLNYYRCAPVQVYDALKEIGTSPFPYALVFVMLACSLLLYSATRLLFGRQAYAMQSKAATQYAPNRARGWQALLVMLPFIAVCAAALLPHLAVILTSFSAPGGWYHTGWPTQFTGVHYLDALGHEMTVSSIRNSLWFSSLAVGINLALGTAIAFVVVRSTIPLRGLLDAITMVPLAVPGLVMAFGYLAISSYLGNLEWVKGSDVLSGMLDVRTNPTLFLVIAYAVRRLPYMVRTVTAGLQQTSVTLEESAANLGAAPFTVARRITLPLIMANVIAGILLAFAFSMLEVSDSLMLAQRADYYPITKTIYELFQLIGTGKFVAAALGVWAMAFLAVTILGAGLLLGKKMGSLFRL